MTPITHVVSPLRHHQFLRDGFTSDLSLYFYQEGTQIVEQIHIWPNKSILLCALAHGTDLPWSCVNAIKTWQTIGMARGQGGCLPQHPVVGNLALQTDRLGLNEDSVELNYYFLILVLTGKGGEGIKRWTHCTEILYSFVLPSIYLMSDMKPAQVSSFSCATYQLCILGKFTKPFWISASPHFLCQTHGGWWRSTECERVISLWSAVIHKEMRFQQVPTVWSLKTATTF